MGFPRSGSSLVGQLLNAHRHIVLSHESDVLRHLDERATTRAQLFGMILENDRAFVKKGASGAGGTEFAVPGQWQGKTERLRVIGDKKAGASTTRLARNPGLLDELRDVVAVPIRIINPVRNPFDNIASIAKMGGRSLDAAVDVYFKFVDDIGAARARMHDGEFHRLHYDNLVADTRVELDRLCRFLDVDAPPDFLDACASIVFPSPRRTRTSAPWTPALVADVERRIADVDFLAGYSYES